MSSKIKCLVTGGVGFVGRRLVYELNATGLYEVFVLDLFPPSDDQKFPPEVHFLQVDLTNRQNVIAAFKDIRIVFHVATVIPTGNNAQSQNLMHKVNVEGTQNVIDACIQNGVEKLIYTSTASVVFDGSDILYKSESELDYSRKPLDYYTGTKIQAEQLVLKANGQGNLATCALRPSTIFGENDRLLVPTLVKRAKEGKMKFIIGDGENLMESTYVGNVVQAHLLAAEKLTLNSPVAGQAYFITNHEPKKFWEFTGDLLEGLGYPRPHIKLPFLLLLFVAFIFEYLIRPLLKPFVDLQTDLTVTRMYLVTRNRAFDCEKAKTELGYIPKVSMEEATRRTIESFRHLRNTEAESFKNR